MYENIRDTWWCLNSTWHIYPAYDFDRWFVTGREKRQLQGERMLPANWDLSVGAATPEVYVCRHTPDPHWLDMACSICYG